MSPVQDPIGRKQRHDVEVDAVAYRGDGSKALVTISNLSHNGCRIDSASEFHVGERLQIAMPRMGFVRAQVRWVSAGSAGAKFLTESNC